MTSPQNEDNNNTYTATYSPNNENITFLKSLWCDSVRAIIVDVVIATVYSGLDSVYNYMMHV